MHLLPYVNTQRPVGISTAYSLFDQGSISDGSGDLSPFHDAQLGCGLHSASYTKSTRDSFPGKAARG